MIRVVNRIPRARVNELETWATVVARRIWTGASCSEARGRPLVLGGLVDGAARDLSRPPGGPENSQLPISKAVSKTDSRTRFQ